MKFTDRQLAIIDIVKKSQPISAENIAKKLGFSKTTLRTDLSVLTMTGILDARPKVGYYYAGQPYDSLLFDTLFEETVESVMMPPLFVQQETSVYDAVITLFMYDVGSLYVQDEEEQFVGVISRKDLLRGTIHSGDAKETPVAVIMSRMPNIITVHPKDRLIDAGYLLVEHKVDSLPVTDSEERTHIIGKVTKTRLFHHFIKCGMKIEEEKIN